MMISLERTCIVNKYIYASPEFRHERDFEVNRLLSLCYIQLSNAQTLRKFGC